MCKSQHRVTLAVFLVLVGIAVVTSPAFAGDDDYSLYKAQRAALEKQLAPEKTKCIATQDPDACQNVSVIKEQMKELDQQNQGVVAAHQLQEMQKEADKEAVQQMTTSITRALAGDTDAQEYVLAQAVAGDEDARRATIALAKRWNSPLINSGVQQLAQQGYAPAQQLLKKGADAQFQEALSGDKQAEATITERAQSGDGTVIPVLIELAKRGDATAQIAVLHWAEESADHGAFGQPIMPDLGTAEVIQGLPRDSTAWTVIRRYPDQAQALLTELKSLPAISTSPVTQSPTLQQNMPASGTMVASSAMSQQPGSAPARPVMAPAYSGASTSAAAIGSATVKPSFNCALAHTVVEGMICGSPELSALDSKLSSLYQTRLASGSDATLLRSQQRAWMHQRNGCGASVSCLERTYQERIAQLQ